MSYAQPWSIFESCPQSTWGKQKPNSQACQVKKSLSKQAKMGFSTVLSRPLLPLLIQFNVI